MHKAMFDTLMQLVRGAASTRSLMTAERRPDGDYMMILQRLRRAEKCGYVRRVRVDDPESLVMNTRYNNPRSFELTDEGKDALATELRKRRDARLTATP